MHVLACTEKKTRKTKNEDGAANKPTLVSIKVTRSNLLVRVGGNVLVTRTGFISDGSF
jgi:hypothetical protein